MAELPLPTVEISEARSENDAAEPPLLVVGSAARLDASSRPRSSSSEGTCLKWRVRPSIASHAGSLRVLVPVCTCDRAPTDLHLSRACRRCARRWQEVSCQRSKESLELDWPCVAAVLASARATFGGVDRSLVTCELPPPPSDGPYKL